ncbi:MAG: DUF4405 domain-containing protein [SAR324 cluster bacterium]|nr:DUF4405 domain-containing protein [SAR324 cluster bacterium]MBL7034708.1 DUF4405 domain-containing protein [SAR324 cluster bacterium]
MVQSKFSYRILTTLFVTFDFLILLFTGVVLYVVPPGRVANWINWELFGLEKGQWSAVHTLSALLFLIVSCIHIAYNWKPLMNYFYKKASGVHRVREMGLAMIICGIFVYSGISSSKPLSYVLEWGEKFKNSWVEEKLSEQSRGQPQHQSLVSTVEKLELDLAFVVEKLRLEGFQIQSEEDTLEEIANENGVSPKQLFALIEPPTAENQVQTSSTPGQSVEESLSGKGYGRKTMRDLSTELGKPLEAMLTKAEQQGVSTDGDALVKDLAEKLGITPLEFVNSLLSKESNSASQ